MYISDSICACLLTILRLKGVPFSRYFPPLEFDRDRRDDQQEATATRDEIKELSFQVAWFSHRMALADSSNEFQTLLVNDQLAVLALVPLQKTSVTIQLHWHIHCVYTHLPSKTPYSVSTIQTKRILHRRRYLITSDKQRIESYIESLCTERVTVNPIQFFPTPSTAPSIGRS